MLDFNEIVLKKNVKISLIVFIFLYLLHVEMIIFCIYSELNKIQHENDFDLFILEHFKIN